MSHSNPHATDPQDSVHYIHELEEHDSWFRHSANEPHHQQAHGETNAWGIIGFMVFTLIAVAVTSVVVYQFYMHLTVQVLVELDERRTPAGEYISASTEWQGRLASYGWVDPAAGTVQVPLSVARRRVIEEYAQSGGGR